MKSSVYSQLSKETVFHLRHREANADLLVVDDGVVVRKGATIVREPVPSFRTYCPGAAKMRKEALESGAIARQKGELVLIRDHFFTSASTAAGFVKGNNTGPDAWTSHDGKRLGALLRKLKERAA